MPHADGTHWTGGKKILQMTNKSPAGIPLPAANDVNGMYQPGKIPEQCQEDIKPEVHADPHLEKDAQGRNYNR